MRVAVIYTGQVRTLEKTLKYFLRNVVLHEEVHVFAVLESNNPKKYQEFLEHELKSHLKALEWLDPNDFCWLNLKERLLSNMNITAEWKLYLRNSGSMIEYYQLYQAYQALVKFEYLNNFRYDYIIRTRPDIVITIPLDFNWLNLDETEVRERMAITMQKTGNDYPMTTYNISLFMNSLLDPKRIQENLHFKNHIVDTLLNPERIQENLHFKNHTVNAFINYDPNTWSLEDCYNFLEDYIKTGKYLLSLRTNLVYIVKREFFYLIPTLGISYGLFKTPDNEYWFDAESQFQEIAIQSGLAIYDSTTKSEADSLYYYKEENYFKPDGELKENTGGIFFICRK